MADRFKETRNVLRIANSFIDVVEDLCVEDFTSECGDLENAKAEELEHGEAQFAGDYRVVSQDDFELNPTVFLSAKKTPRGDAAKNTLYQLFVCPLIGSGVELEFLYVPKRIDVLGCIGISDDTSPMRFLDTAPSAKYIEHTLSAFKHVIANTRKLRDADRLKSIPSGSYWNTK